MLKDLCNITDMDTVVFNVGCIVTGVLLGVLIAYLTRKRDCVALARLGCLTVLPIAAVSAFVANHLFPDPRHVGEECGFTPDVIFWPVYAFVLVPIGMGVTLAVFRWLSSTPEGDS